MQTLKSIHRTDLTADRGSRDGEPMKWSNSQPLIRIPKEKDTQNEAETASVCLKIFQK